MTSVHLYQAEKKDVENIYDLLVEFKDEDLSDLNLPDVDKPKLLTFINDNFIENSNQDKKQELLIILLEYFKIKKKMKKIILLKNLDKNKLVGLCIFYKSELWFSKDQVMNIHVIYIKKNFRSYKLLKTMIDSVKKVSDGLPIFLAITTGLKIDAVFKRLGFENLGSNWRMM